MKKNFKINLRFKLLAGIFLTSFSMGMAANSFADTLGHHVPPEVKNGTANFKYHASQFINAQIIMPLGNQASLSTLLQNLYDLKSPSYHHFLTPTQFTQQFSASTIDSAQVQQYLKSEGITVTGQSPNGAVLYVSGPSWVIEKAFGLHINTYQKSDGTTFYAPDAEPTIPATLAGKILAVGGLDNLPKYRAHRHQNTMALPKAAGTAPGGFLAPSDVKTAYNLNSVPSTGVGQSVALFELDGYKASDIAAYESKFSLLSVPLSNVLIDGFNGTPNFGSTGGADEVTLDIELVAAFAPGSSIYVYEAPNTTQSWIDEWTKIASDDKAKVISCSWGEAEMDSPTINFDNQIFQQMAAQGQAVFVASGDSGAYDAGGTVLATDEPASQPFATAVGISKLTTGAGQVFSSESASTDGGGGVSSVWSIPAYQLTLAKQAVAAAKVSTTMRNLPDVVLTADPATAYYFIINGSGGGWWGSSLAAPIWASFISRVNQGLGSNAPIGSVNSALYALAQTSNYTNDFHDITTGNNGYYPAGSGFDDATGLGSFNGLNLYNDLVKTAVVVTPPLAPTGLTASAGNAQVTLSWKASVGAISYNVSRSTTSNGIYSTIKSLVLNTAYVDASVSNGTTYYYEVSAVNLAGQGANSAFVSAKPVLPPPVAPAGLSAVGQSGQVVLSWSAVQGAGSYNVKRALSSSGSYTTMASGVVKTTYTDTSVTNGTVYYYVVSAVNASGQSGNSAPVSATPAAPSTVAAPTNFTGVLSSFWGNRAVLLQWKQSTSPNILKYNIYRSTGTGSPVFYASLGASYAGAYDPSVTHGTTYNYFITTVNTKNVESVASNKISVAV